MLAGLCLFTCLLISCYKEPIKFGDMGNDNYTRVITIDTITPILSTYVLDSFPTSNNNILLIGRWEDPLMGTTRANTFFQLGLPASIANLTFPNDAVYDSLAMTLRPNKSILEIPHKHKHFPFMNLLINLIIPIQANCSTLP
ncbi:DUF4270 family protein [Paraflavitalea speifideaquila]|uniref:DUF4270 family protein n=1 Tax=Paraflavitalea speifideaquila TaxID=3076558 RepID=UPI003312FF50